MSMGQQRLVRRQQGLTWRASPEEPACRHMRGRLGLWVRASNNMNAFGGGLADPCREWRPWLECVGSSGMDVRAPTPRTSIPLDPTHSANGGHGWSAWDPAGWMFAAWGRVAVGTTRLIAQSKASVDDSMHQEPAPRGACTGMASRCDSVAWSRAVGPAESMWVRAAERICTAEIVWN